MRIKKTNYVLISLGAVIAVVATLNYILNEDHISLGIFAFIGLGFILLGVSSGKSFDTAKRINKLAYLLFAAALAVLVYWFLYGKLEIL
ncbi:MAG: hypothetical protein U9N85_13040 [Bacteroidota bacterium]|nr:hypothetical protein [Bacteroidota bacterium]